MSAETMKTTNPLSPRTEEIASGPKMAQSSFFFLCLFLFFASAQELKHALIAADSYLHCNDPATMTTRKEYTTDNQNYITKCPNNPAQKAFLPTGHYPQQTVSVNRYTKPPVAASLYMCNI